MKYFKTILSTHLNIINGGVNRFDFDVGLNLLATANQNTLVNLRHVF